MQLNDVALFCGEQSFNRGKQQSLLDNFSKLLVQGEVLFGLYYGTVGLYRINIVIKGNNNITYAWCTCPAMSEWPGYCKHIAGLLINWVTHDNRFKKLQVWSDALHNKTKKELIELITTCTSKSIDVTHTLYEELFNEAILDDEEELYDPYGHW